MLAFWILYVPRMHTYTTYVVEMQQYIDISAYRDTLGSDTVSIHIYVGRINISNTRGQQPSKIAHKI